MTLGELAVIFLIWSLTTAFIAAIIALYSDPDESILSILFNSLKLTTITVLLIFLINFIVMKLVNLGIWGYVLW